MSHARALVVLSIALLGSLPSVGCKSSDDADDNGGSGANTAGSGGRSGGGTGGTDPGGPTTVQPNAPGDVGYACEKDQDCASGNVCWTASGDSFEPGGPAGGYCTKTCQASTDCGNWGTCVELKQGKAKYCFRTCLFGKPSTKLPNDMDSDNASKDKCFGRKDVGCKSVWATATDGTAVYTNIDLCVPQCSVGENRCPAGRTCDVQLGYCVDATTWSPELKENGEPCDLTIAKDKRTCRGACYPIYGADDPKAPADRKTTAGVCVDPCTLGTYQSCNFTPGAVGVCTISAVFGPGQNVFSQTGDVGMCAKVVPRGEDCKCLWRDHQFSHFSSVLNAATCNWSWECQDDLDCGYTCTKDEDCRATTDSKNTCDPTKKRCKKEDGKPMAFSDDYKCQTVGTLDKKYCADHDVEASISKCAENP